MSEGIGYAVLSAWQAYPFQENKKSCPAEGRAGFLKR
jgi:hypothetical protein